MILVFKQQPRINQFIIHPFSPKLIMNEPFIRVHDGKENIDMKKWLYSIFFPLKTYQ